MRAPAIPVVLCIDAEPDAFLTGRDRPLPWRGFEAAVGRIARLRRDVSRDGLAPHFSWFFRLDPQIAETYGAAASPSRTLARSSIRPSRPDPRLLVLVVRTDAFDDPDQRANVDANLAHVLARPEAAAYRWSTPEEAVRLLGVP